MQSFDLWLREKMSDYKKWKSWNFGKRGTMGAKPATEKDIANSKKQLAKEYKRDEKKQINDYEIVSYSINIVEITILLLIILASVFVYRYFTAGINPEWKEIVAEVFDIKGFIVNVYRYLTVPGADLG